MSDGDIQTEAPAPDAAPTETPATTPAAGGSATEKAQAPATTQDPGTPFYKSLPETWREDLVKGLELGESEQNVLNRYTDFPSFSKAFFEQNKKIRSGLQETAGLPENPTEDQIKEYREANGIPAEPSGYKAELQEGIVLSAEDDRILNAVWEVAHRSNVKPELMGELQNAMFAARAAESDRVLNQHGLDRQECERHLRDHWAQDYETNINVIRGLLNTIPAELKEAFEQIEMPDGKKVFNHPVLAQWFADVGRKLNPSATVVPNAANPYQAIKGELDKIDEIMRTDPDKYWGDPAMQKRYQDLLQAQEDMAAA